MATNTAEDLYALVQQLPAAERLRLVEKIAHDLSGAASGAPVRQVPTLPREAWESAIGSIALGGDALADGEGYYDES